MKVEIVPIDSVHLDPANVRKHPERNLEAIKGSLQRFRQQKPIVVDEHGVVRAGNGTLEAARALGWKDIAIVRSGLKGAELSAFAIADNRTAELALWDGPALSKQVLALLEEGVPLSDIGFTDEEIAALRVDDEPVVVPDSPGEATPEVKDPPVPEAPSDAKTRPGDLYYLGEHRILCADCRHDDGIPRLLGEEKVEVCLTDPPYCSGSFQEAGKEAGTWGDIACDQLSSRGYQALITQCFKNVRAKVCYVFTDWRMWIPLFDVMESSGFPARSMIVWDKGSAGLGGLWRPQHELVMFCSREGSKRIKGIPAVGNVLKSKRTGNIHHYTEKPVDLLYQILKNDSASGRVGTVIDPFLGSGSTLLACEQLKRRCVGFEVEPKIVDVAVARWEGMTGKKAELQRKE